VIELQYVCLLLGYEGVSHRRAGQTRSRMQHGLFRIIRDARQLRDEELIATLARVEDKRNPIFRYVPWWIVGCAGLAVIVIAS
jgi:type VI protein secretion system component VasF